ncbi:OmpA family protein [Jiulongibacter sp. NS-SX5]|uniref:OmpA family protein n=1 Tax=Jiulongibacter sp. NS-SX5 TaxID=3463854 RepID=UPI004059A7FA
MFKKVFILLLFAYSAISQEVLWADKVIEVSSEQTDQYYSPKNRGIQILGTPSIYPQMTATPCAWQPNGSDFGEDYIKVGFEKAIKVKQIALIENWNPGAVARIFGYDANNLEYLLYQSNGNTPNARKRFWRIYPESTPDIELNAIKLVINHRLTKGIKQYDAIAISDSDQPIEFDINLAEDIPKGLKKKNLGNIVNSEFGEVAPIITPDGQTLYFTRLDHPGNVQRPKNDERPVGQDIWYSELNEMGLWNMPLNMGEPINNEFDNAAATAPANGKTLYILNVYHPSGKMLKGLSKTVYDGNNWSIPEKVEIKNFQALGEVDPYTNVVKISTEYTISHDESVLVMGLQRSQTFGGKDLYVSFKQEDGSYSLPKNMGQVINTADNEGSPFLSADMKTLYFNSNGHPGYGDADIYVTRRLDDTWTNWTEPLNLGPQINSDKWDGYFSIPASGDFAYLSSKDHSIGGEDIFKIELFDEIKPDPMVIMNGQITDASNSEGIYAPISFVPRIDSIQGPKIELQINRQTGEYTAMIPAGNIYDISLEKSGFIGINDSLNLLDTKDFKEIQKNFELIPLREGYNMILKNVAFEQGKFDLTPSSFDALEKITSIMREYPTMSILLEGYTDNQGDFTLNVQLAENRVNAVKNYLVEKGKINADRIETKAWGPLKPISSNATPELREKNRRVEFTILKM